jgi:uncharacterized protein YaaR (DUF327 family)
MAKIDSADPTVFMNPSAYSGVKDGKKTGANRSARKGEKTDFSNIFSNLLGKTADEIGPLQNLSVSDESVNILMDEVRNTGDVLINRPLPEEIMRYKQAVRNFINYVVNNCYTLDHEEGIPNKFKPGFRGRRSSPEAEKSYGYTRIQVIDKKLEDLAAILLANQGRQMELISRLEEIRGLLVDLLQ